jgi:hypothetical protein
MYFLVLLAWEILHVVEIGGGLDCWLSECWSAPKNALSQNILWVNPLLPRTKYCQFATFPGDIFRFVAIPLGFGGNLHNSTQKTKKDPSLFTTLPTTSDFHISAHDFGVHREKYRSDVFRPHPR